LFSRRQDGSVRLQHQLAYWWPIWVGLRLRGPITSGIGVGDRTASRDETVLFHPSPWPESFIGVVLFVASPACACGVYSFVLIWSWALVYWLVAHLGSARADWRPAARAELAFYRPFRSRSGGYRRRGRPLHGGFLASG
jgi:hypothetical protein